MFHMLDRMTQTPDVSLLRIACEPGKASIQKLPLNQIDACLQA